MTRQRAAPHVAGPISQLIRAFHEQLRAARAAAVALPPAIPDDLESGWSGEGVGPGEAENEIATVATEVFAPREAAAEEPEGPADGGDAEASAPDGEAASQTASPEPEGVMAENGGAPREAEEATEEPRYHCVICLRNSREPLVSWRGKSLCLECRTLLRGF